MTHHAIKRGRFKHVTISRSIDMVMCPNPSQFTNNLIGIHNWLITFVLSNSLLGQNCRATPVRSFESTSLHRRSENTDSQNQSR